MNAPLTAENLETHIPLSKDGLLLDTTVWGYLRSSGYNIEELRELHTVAREGSDTGHIVAKLRVSTKPTDDPEYDSVAHQADIWTCDCWNFLDEHWVDLREYGNSPTDAGACRHIEQCDKSQKAANDENQDTIV